MPTFRRLSLRELPVSSYNALVRMDLTMHPQYLYEPEAYWYRDSTRARWSGDYVWNVMPIIRCEAIYVAEYWDIADNDYGFGSFGGFVHAMRRHLRDKGLEHAADEMDFSAWWYLYCGRDLPYRIDPDNTESMPTLLALAYLANQYHTGGWNSRVTSMSVTMLDALSLPFDVPGTSEWQEAVDEFADIINYVPSPEPERRSRFEEY
jgi:hypothetical protein